MAISTILDVTGCGYCADDHRKRAGQGGAEAGQQQRGNADIGGEEGQDLEHLVEEADLALVEIDAGTLGTMLGAFLGRPADRHAHRNPAFAICRRFAEFLERAVDRLTVIRLWVAAVTLLRLRGGHVDERVGNEPARK